MNETLLRARDKKRIANIDVNKTSFKVTIRSVSMLNACIHSNVFDGAVFSQHEYHKHNVKRIYFTCVFNDLNKLSVVKNELIKLSNLIIDNELICLSDRWYDENHQYNNYINDINKVLEKERKALKSVKKSSAKKSAMTKKALA
jgi:hypothetical protein